MIEVPFLSTTLGIISAQQKVFKSGGVGTFLMMRDRKSRQSSSSNMCRARSWCSKETRVHPEIMMYLFVVVVEMRHSLVPATTNTIMMKS